MAILQSQRRLLAVVFLHAVGKPETRPPGTWEKARQGDPTQAAKTRPHPRLEITVDCTLIINLPLRIIHIIHSGKKVMLDSRVCHATQNTEGNHDSLGGGKVICRPTLENGHRTTGPIGYNFEVLLAAPNHSILQRSMLRNFSGGSICLPNNSKSLVGNSSQLIPHDPTQSTCPAVVAP